MIRITEIVEVKPFEIICKFNNGAVKNLKVKPLLDNHKHLHGIDKLYSEDQFRKVRIGKMGELVWDNIISISYNGKETVWDYDISPEFALENSVQFKI